MSGKLHVGLVSLTDVDYGLDLANALYGGNAEVSLYMGHSATARAIGDSGQPEVGIYERGLLPRQVKLKLFRAPKMRDPRSIVTVYQLAHKMRRDRIDVAHILVGSGELWMAALGWVLANVPVVSTIREPVANVGDYPPRAVVAQVNRLACRASDLIVVNAKMHVEQIQARYKVPTSEVDYVPLGPRTTAVRWSRKAVDEEAKTSLFFGRVSPNKGLEYLIRAYARVQREVPEARLIIAGKGPDMARCSELAADMQGVEIHNGFVANDTAAELFQRAAVVVLPYISASTSGVLMTAYAFGKPVVTTKVGGLPEYVKEARAGCVVPPADVEKLAGAILTLLNDGEMRRERGENAKAWAGKLESEIAGQMIRSYQKAILLHRSGKGFHRLLPEGGGH